MRGVSYLNRSRYFNYIEEKISILSTRIERRSKINLLDLNIHSENFFAELCNRVFSLNFVNANTIKQNIEGIDLIDDSNHVLAQVSSTCTKKKIQNSLNKSIYRDYCGYNYKFISIAKGATSSIKKQAYKNPNSLVFDPQNDIWDPISLLKHIQAMDIEELREFYEFIENELGQDVDILKIDTNLAKIVKILSEENLDINSDYLEINDFAIEDKIKFNNLVNSKDIIDEYKIFYKKLDTIYSEFDKQGQNKSFSVFQEIKRCYIRRKDKGLSSDEIFYQIIDELISLVRKSSNYEELPFEELHCCIYIIVVDAFVRCKIFKNPGEYNYVIT